MLFNELTFKTEVAYRHNQLQHAFITKVQEERVNKPAENKVFETVKSLVDNDHRCVTC